MKTFELKIIINEGYDEVWDDLKKLSPQQQASKLATEMVNTLNNNGFDKLDIIPIKFEETFE